MNDIETKNIIFLDRDGTICVDGGAFQSHDYGSYDNLINNVILVEGVEKSLKRLKEKGFLIIVISNQAGVAKGKMTESDVHRFNKKLNEKLDNLIDGFYYCIHHDTGEESDGRILYGDKIIKELIVDCDCRKPKIGMFKQAEDDLRNGKIQTIDEKFLNSTIIYDKSRNIYKKSINKTLINKNKSYMIGDKLIDTMAGINYGIKSFLVLTGEGKTEYEKSKSVKNKVYDKCFDDINETSNYILEELV